MTLLPRIPMVHLNGTSQTELVSRRIEASLAIRRAIDTLYEAAPNMRDYYVKPNGETAFRIAVQFHNARVKALHDVMLGLHEEVEAIQDQ